MFALALALGRGSYCQALWAPVLRLPQLKLAFEDSRKLGVTLDFDFHAWYLDRRKIPVRHPQGPWCAEGFSDECATSFDTCTSLEQETSAPTTSNPARREQSSQRILDHRYERPSKVMLSTSGLPSLADEGRQPAARPRWTNSRHRIDIRRA